MNIIQPLFAEDSLPLDVVSAPWQKMDSTTRDILIILGAVALVTVFILLWAVIFRSKRKRQRRHHHHHHHSHDAHTETRAETTSMRETTSEPEHAEESGSRRKRRRHRRREHRPRNPTLAETGGLPPLRTAPPPEP